MPVTPSGLMAGIIASVTANTITVTGAGWTVGQLAQPGYPLFVSITSGTNEGRAFLVTGNTAGTLTLGTQGADLSTLGFDSTTTFKIIAGDTLLGLFGTPADGVIGGTSTQFTAGQVDKVSVNDISTNTLYTYYYNTTVGTSGQWRRAGSSADQGAVVISPLAGVLYQRIGATALNITTLGTVPSLKLKTVLPAIGTTIIARFFPTDTTLGAIGIENMTGWRKANANGVTVANSDRVIIKNGTAFYSYYYDASSPAAWKRAGSGADQGVIPVLAGSALRIQRAGAVGSFGVCEQTANYTFTQ